MVAVVTVPGVLPGVVARMIVGCRSIVCPARVVVTVTVCIWSVAAFISSMSSCLMNVWPSTWPWPCWCAAAAWFCLWIVRFSGFVVFTSSLSNSENIDKTCSNLTLHSRFRNLLKIKIISNIFFFFLVKMLTWEVPGELIFTTILPFIYVISCKLDTPILGYILGHLLGLFGFKGFSVLTCKTWYLLWVAIFRDYNWALLFKRSVPRISLTHRCF